MKTSNKNRQHCCKTSWEAKVRVFTAYKPNLSWNKSGCCELRENWLYLKLRGIESSHTLEWRHLLQNKFALGRQSEQHVQNLLQQVELLSTFCNNFSQPATTWFVVRQFWFVCAKTCNIAFQHVLPSAMLPKTTWNFSTPVLPCL